MTLTAAADSFLAASSGLLDRRARLEKPTSPLRNRVWGFSVKPKGRLLSSRPLRRRTAIGYRAYRYKTASGRRNFLQSDPIRFAAGDVNIYRYVGNRVLAFVDPLGLEPGAIPGVTTPVSTPMGPPQSVEMAARMSNGTGNYQVLSPATAPNWLGKPKCNKFVGDMISLVPGMPPPLVNDRYPTAREWTDSDIDIPGFSAPHSDPMPGDVVSDGAHVGIKTSSGVIQAPTEKDIYEAPPSVWNPSIGRTPKPKCK